MGRKKHERFNLKNKKIRDIFNFFEIPTEENLLMISENTYVETIVNYRNFLNYIMLDNEFEIQYQELCLSSRVKFPNSLMSKLYIYCNEKKEKGKVSVNKCLNDILGFRIILNIEDDYDSLYCSLKELLNDINNVKVIKTYHKEYNAIHIYFKENNYTFPWELQIWLKEHETKNLNSHKMYKQDYTKWEFIYRNTK